MNEKKVFYTEIAYVLGLASVFFGRRNVLSVQLHKDVAVVKTVYDCCSCGIAVILSFAFFGFWHFEGVKLGTIVCALINGWLIGKISHSFDKHFDFRDAMPLKNMKRLLSLLLCLAMISVLGGCGGDITEAKTKAVPSDIYSEEEIDAAIQVIKTEFDRNWDGCKLTEIYYAGDEISLDHQDWADRNNADEVIVLLSSFDVDDSGGDGSLNPNSTYNNWNWILVRNAGGQWKHVDHGY